MSRVAIITDSASDLPASTAAAAGIAIVPLEVSFGDERFTAGVDLTTEQFWTRMSAPDAPIPKTAAASVGQFRTAYDEAFAAGADAVVCVAIAGTLSGTLKSATIARDDLHAERPDREVIVVNSGSASMGEGLLALMATEMSEAGSSAADIAAVLEERKTDLNLYIALDTLEYLKRGGRISGTKAAVGTLLSVKPIITIRDGAVDSVEQVRTRSKARERVLELLSDRPVSGSPSSTRWPRTSRASATSSSAESRAGSTRPACRPSRSARRSGRTSVRAASGRSSSTRDPAADRGRCPRRTRPPPAAHAPAGTLQGG